MDDASAQRLPQLHHDADTWRDTLFSSSRELTPAEEARLRPDLLTHLYDCVGGLCADDEDIQAVITLLTGAEALKRIRVWTGDGHVPLVVSYHLLEKSPYDL